MKQPSWMLRAILQAESPHHRRVVDDAHRIIRWALSEFGEPAVTSLSGGKDSVAMAHLVSQHCASPILWNDSGLELPESEGIVREVCSMLNLPLTVTKGNALAVKLAKGSERAEATADSTTQTCIVRPARRALAELGARCNFVGLRIGESRLRRMVIGSRGDGYLSKTWGCGIAWPLRAWSGLDSIAYIVRHHLPLHPAYLRGDLPENIRVSWIWDSSRERFGEFDIMRRDYPRIFQTLRRLGVTR